MSNSVIFFQNQDDIDLFVKNRICRPQLITRIPGSGVNIDAYAPSPFPDRITFLFLGRYLYDKGVREWFGALSILRSKGCDFDACMVGWADDNPSSASPEYIREQVERLGINNIGRVKDVRPCIQGSSILVLPSYREGISKSTLEAMAMGRPVITTNAPGCRETIVHDESGLLVEVKSDERLADAMEYFLNKPDEIVRMGANARRRAEQVFDVKIVNGIIVKALSSALSQR